MILTRDFNIFESLAFCSERIFFNLSIPHFMTPESFPAISASPDYFVGFDIGSVSLNTVILDANNNILEEHYDYVHGRPFNVLRDRLSSVMDKYSSETIKGIAFTGTGGKLATGLIGGVFVNEIIAQATSTGI